MVGSVEVTGPMLRHLFLCLFGNYKSPALASSIIGQLGQRGQLSCRWFYTPNPTGKTPQMAPVRGYVAWTSGQGSRNHYTLPRRLQLCRLDLWTYTATWYFFFKILRR